EGLRREGGSNRIIHCRGKRSAPAIDKDAHASRIRARVWHGNIRTTVFIKITYSGTSGCGVGGKDQGQAVRGEIRKEVCGNRASLIEKYPDIIVIGIDDSEIGQGVSIKIGSMNTLRIRKLGRGGDVRVSEV